MKKLLTFLITFGLLVGGTVSASLYNYWNERGLPFIPCNSERYQMAEFYGIENYDCSAEKNDELKLALEASEGELLGGTRANSPFAGFTYTLAGSGLTSSATSLTLQSLTLKQTGYEIQDNELSDTFYITLEPGNTKRQEIVSCTTVTQNADNTATLSGCTRGLLPFYPYTSSSTLQFAHAGGTSVIFSDPPQLFEEYVSKTSSSTVSVRHYYDVLPEASSSLLATTTNQFVTKEYADAIANQGAATSTEAVAGIAEQATQLEMASSTPFDANNPHFSSSEYATTTPYTHTDLGNYAVIGTNSGYIDWEWINKSEAYVAWTGDHNFPNVSSTAVTSTSIGATTVSSTNAYVGSVSLNQLIDGSDVASTIHNHSYLGSFVSSSSQTVTHTTAAELAIVSTTITNILGTDECVKIEMPMTNYSNTNPVTWTLDLQYGSDTIATITDGTAYDGSTGEGMITAVVCGDGTTSKQFGYLTLDWFGLDAFPPAGATTPIRETAFGTATQNSTNAIPIRITSEWSATTGSPTVTYRSPIVYQLTK